MRELFETVLTRIAKAHGNTLAGKVQVLRFEKKTS